jgi:hypothetical protein
MATGKSSRSSRPKALTPAEEETRARVRAIDDRTVFADPMQPRGVTLPRIVNPDEAPQGRGKLAQHHIESDDEEDLDGDGSTAGLREVGVARKNKGEHGHAHNHDDVPLRNGKIALQQSFHVAISKHADALAYINKKVERASRGGLFSTKFTFGEVEGLGASSHAEYVAFVQLLDILGYTAKYSNGKGSDPESKEVFQPPTVIFLDWLPRKK